MAKEKKFVQAITSRDEDFAQWYTDVVREAKLCDYSSVKGCLNYLPNGYDYPISYTGTAKPVNS